eukprot:TRINITY_DN881_c0_g1_i1.p1 TRINITY_DN881_c0_g1~~TRINITY_DN881_c0_g1_i1.p1  ORF type:complete len:3939 (-),score=1134.74 TRINITY_DN881_c0_g1_i1:193-12009(-)
MKIKKSSLSKRAQSLKVTGPQKHLISVLLSANDSELLDVLSSIKQWPFEKSDLAVWVDVLNKCDSILEVNSPKPQPQQDGGRPSSPPSHNKSLLLQVLRFTIMLIENNAGHSLYNSVDHLLNLTSTEDTEVLVEVLRVLSTLLSRPAGSWSSMDTQGLRRIHNDETLHARLSTLARGWGGRLEGVGMHFCSHDVPAEELPQAATTLHFEFHQKEEGQSNEGRHVIIHIPNMDVVPDSDSAIVDALVKQYNIPADLQFPLAVRVRLARHAPSLAFRQRWALVRMLSLTVLAPCIKAEDEGRVPDFFRCDPDFVAEMLDLLKDEPQNTSLTEGPRRVTVEMRVAAIDALASLCFYPHILEQILEVGGASTPHGTIPSLLRKCVAAMTRASSVEVPSSSSSSSPSSASTISSSELYPFELVRAAFNLLQTMLRVNTGGSSFGSAGIMSSMMPLIKHADPQASPAQLRLVTKAIAILQHIMNVSTHSMTSFQETGGLDDLMERVRAEIDLIADAERRHQSDLAAKTEGKGKTPTRSGTSTPTITSTGSTPSMGSPAVPRKMSKGKGRSICKDAHHGHGHGHAHPHVTLDPSLLAEEAALKSLNAHRSLLRSLLMFVSPLIRQQGAKAMVDRGLPLALKALFDEPKRYGTPAVAVGLSMAARLLHSDPMGFNTLQTLGLVDSIIKFVTNPNIVASGDILSAIPSVLTAMCLDQTHGLPVVTESHALPHLLNLLALPKYATACSGRTATTIGAGVDELMRHQASFKSIGIEATIKLLENIYTSYGGTPAAVTASDSSSTSTTSLSSSSSSSTSLSSSSSSSSTSISTPSITPKSPREEGDHSDEKISSSLVESIGNAARYLEALFAHGDHGRVFMEKGGVDRLVSLFTHPALPLSFAQNGSSQSLALVFRSLSAQNASGLMSAVVQIINAQFTTLNAQIPNWREGETLLHEKNRVDNTTPVSEDKRKVAHLLLSLDILVRILSGLLRDPSQHFPSRSASAATMAEWTTERGTQAILDLGYLQRALLWEVSVKENADKTAAAASSQPPPPSSSTTATTTPTLTSSSTPAQSPRTSTSASPSQQTISLSSSSSSPSTTASDLVQQEIAAHQGLIIHLIAGIHTLSVGLSRALTPTARRKEDAILQNVAGPMAKTLTEYLDWKTLANKDLATQPVIRTYLSSFLGELQKLLFDERQIHILLLQSFVHIGGLKPLNALLDDMVSSFEQQQSESTTGTGGDMMEVDASPSTTSTTTSTTTTTPSATATTTSTPSSSPEKQGIPMGSDLERRITMLKTFGRLYKSLTDSRALLSAPMTSSMAATSITGTAFDATIFIQNIHDQVLTTLLPLWKNSVKLAKSMKHDGSFMTLLVSCIENILFWADTRKPSSSTNNNSNINTSGGGAGNAPLPVPVASAGNNIFGTAAAAAASAALRAAAAVPAPVPAPPPPRLAATPEQITMLREMGFSRAHIDEGIRRVQSNSIDEVVDWLFRHPDPGAAAFGMMGDVGGNEPSEEEELARALAMSLGAAIQETMGNLMLPTVPAPPAGGAPALAGSAPVPASVDTSASTPAGDQAASTAAEADVVENDEDEDDDGDDEDEDDEWEDRMEPEATTTATLSTPAPTTTDAASTPSATSTSEDKSEQDKGKGKATEKDTTLLDELRASIVPIVLALLRELPQLDMEGLFVPLADLLLASNRTNEEGRQNVLDTLLSSIEAGETVDKSSLRMLALLLDSDMTLRSRLVGRAPSAVEGTSSSSNNSGAVGVLTNLLAKAASTPISERLPSWTSYVLVLLDQLAQLPLDPELAKQQKPTKPDSKDSSSAAPLPSSLLTPKEQHLILEHAIVLNKRLSTVGQTEGNEGETVLFALLHLLSRLTRTREAAEVFLKANAIEALLSIQYPFGTNNGRRELSALAAGLVYAIFRHLMEDTVTLREAMESTLRITMPVLMGRNSGRVPPRTLLASLASVVCRDSEIFAQAAEHVCRMPSGTNGFVIAAHQQDKHQPTELEGRQTDHITMVIGALMQSIMSSHPAQQSSTPILNRESLPRSALLQFLAGLLADYSLTAQLFLQHSSTWLRHILEHLVPYPHVSSRDVEGDKLDEMQRQNMYSVKVVAALCGGQPANRKVVVKELAEVQRALIEKGAANRSAMDVSDTASPAPPRPSTSFLDAIASHAELLGHLLNARVVMGGQIGQTGSTVIAKLMVEEKMLDSLSVAVSHVDLNNPQAIETVNALLRVLDTLTRYASSDPSSAATLAPAQPGGEPGVIAQDEDTFDLLADLSEHPFMMRQPTTTSTEPQDIYPSDSEGDDDMAEDDEEIASDDEDIDEDGEDDVEDDDEGADDDEIIEEGDEEEDDEEDEEEDEELDDMDQVINQDDEDILAPPLRQPGFGGRMRAADLLGDNLMLDADQSRLFGNLANNPLLAGAGGAGLGDPATAARNLLNSLLGAQPPPPGGAGDFAGGMPQLAFPGMGMAPPGHTAHIIINSPNGMAPPARVIDQIRANLEGRGHALPPNVVVQVMDRNGRPQELRFPNNSAANASSVGTSIRNELVHLPEDIRRLFGPRDVAPEANTGGISARGTGSLATRWTDDGQRVPEMGAYALAFEPVLVERVRVVTRLEEEEEAKKRKIEEEAAKVRKVEEDRIKAEENKVKAEQAAAEAAKKEAEEKEKAQAEAIAEAAAQAEAIVAEAAAAAAAAANAPPVAPMETDANPPATVSSPVAPSTPQTNAPTPINLSSAAPTGSVPPSTANPASSSSSSSSSSAPVAATVIMPELDPLFLAELPSDLRAEVLAMQLTQATEVAFSQGATTATVHPDFLAVLPPSIQAEVIDQERRILERLLRERERQAAAATVAQEMDNATFLATLTPDLRDEVLLTADEAFISSLPPDLHAEALAVRERAVRNQYRRNAFGASGLPSTMAQGSRGQRGGVPVAPKVQVVLDRPGHLLNEDALLSLVRLLYLESSLARGLLQKVIQNLCVYQDDRRFLTHALISILRACMNKVVVVKSVPSSTTSSSKSLAESLSQSTVTASSPSFNPILEPAHPLVGHRQEGKAASITSEYPPSLVIRRILDILTHLAKSNGAVLTIMFEDFAQAHGQDKSKGKQKAPETEEVVPALVALIELLGASEFTQSSSHLEKLTLLLATIAKAERDHLASQKQAPEAAATATSTPASTTPAAASTTTTTAADNTSSTPSAATTTTTTPSTTSTTSTTTPTAPVSRIPDIPLSQLRTLANVLTLDTCSDIACINASSLITNLSNLVNDTRQLLTSELLRVAGILGGYATVNLQSLMSRLTSASMPPSEILSMFYSPSSHELNLLRVLRNIVTLSTPPAAAAGDKNAASGAAGAEGSSLPPLFGSPALRSSSSLQSLSSLLSPVAGASPTIASPAPVAAPAGTPSSTTPSRSSTPLSISSSGIAPLRQLSLEHLWEVLSGCLSILNSNNTKKGEEAKKTKVKTGAPAPALALMLPVIEAFFLVNAPSSQTSATTASVAAAANTAAATTSTATPPSSLTATSPALPTTPATPATPAANRFFAFAEQHRNLLNELVRMNPSLLSPRTGSFASLLRMPRLLEFDNKRAFFRSQISQDRERDRSHGVRMRVRRSHVFEDSYNQLRKRSADELRGRLTVQFAGEEGIDAGGLLREWFQVLARAMFNENYALFNKMGDGQTHQPNPNSWINPDHLDYFRFVGRVIGKALNDNQMLDAYFTRSFYKHILGVPVHYTDIEAIDPTYYKNLQWLLENDVAPMELTFTAEKDVFGRPEVVELKPNGANIPVTNANKNEYVQLITEMKMTTSIKDQIDAFLRGFHELIPKPLIAIFNELELELLISGLPVIDVDDLRANTEYTGYTPESPQIQWYWHTVQNMSQEERALLVQFVTGTSKVPLDGFKALQGMSGPQKFQIHRVRGHTDRLPSAHTCFNQIDMPEYDTEEQLEKALKLAITEGAEGFGFG